MSDVPQFDRSKLKARRKEKNRRRQHEKNAGDDESKGPALVEVKQVEDVENLQSDNDTPSYTYDDLLKRVFEMIGQSRPEKNKIKIPPAEVSRFGTTKVLWSNFPELLKVLNREKQHLLLYVTIELNTTANLDGNSRLVIKGRFSPGQINKIQKRYVDEYVLCKTCGSKDTMLKKQNRVHILKCESQVCGSERSVAPLNKGYIHTLKRSRKK